MQEFQALDAILDRLKQRLEDSAVELLFKLIGSIYRENYKLVTKTQHEALIQTFTQYLGPNTNLYTLIWCLNYIARESPQHAIQLLQPLNSALRQCSDQIREEINDNLWLLLSRYALHFPDKLYAYKWKLLALKEPKKIANAIIKGFHNIFAGNTIR